MNPIKTMLAHHVPMILDGAFATELEAQGCDLNDPLWSAKVLTENPELISQVHRNYFMAGADCVITASYQATIQGFMGKGFGRVEAEWFIKRSVELACQIRDSFWASCSESEKAGRVKPLVAASVGPYGAFLADGSEYRGKYDIGDEELFLFHRDRMALLVDAGPDLLACETIPCLREARAVIRSLQDHPAMSAWVSFTCMNGEHLRNGDSIADGARWLDGHDQVAAVGVNCTEPQYVSSLIREIRRGTGKPVVVYPNSGETYDPALKRWSGKDNLPSFSAMAKQWHHEGASIIGGCCRTGPDDIRAIRSWVQGS